jgi:hypothetical protein
MLSHKHYVAIAFVVALFVYSQAKAREQYPGQYANAPHHEWYESRRNKAASSCCLEADAHDYFGNYAINPDGSVLLKSGAIPYRIEPYKVLDGPNPTGHAVWWFEDYGDWGITTFCFAPGAGG